MTTFTIYVFEKCITFNFFSMIPLLWYEKKENFDQIKIQAYTIYRIITKYAFSRYFLHLFLTMSKNANLSGLNRKSRKVKVENIKIKTYQFQ